MTLERASGRMSAPVRAALIALGAATGALLLVHIVQTVLVTVIVALEGDGDLA